jgi:O-antigen/teichoic acid export membrane protein
LAIAADIATLGTGTLLAGLFNVALVFVVPKLVSVEDYGYWRMFSLYAGYVGFLHFGFPDGALLRWAGRPMAEFHHEIRPALKYLFWQHVVVVVVLCALAAVALRGPLRFVGIAVSIYALFTNLGTLLRLGLQSARIFRPVAISTVAAPALFLGLVLMWRWKWHSDYREVTALYATGALIVLVFLLAWTKPWSGARGGVRVTALAKECVLSGWPIVTANTGVALLIYADRLAVSWAATIQNFAQYSLAASAMAVPITAIQACNQAFFPHLAGVTREARTRIYGIASQILLMAWVVLLPYYFALEVFVRRVLPRYVPSLQYARIMLLGIPFLATIQILQMSYAYLNGMQKQFLAQTMAVLAVSLGAAAFVAFTVRSLPIVAGVQIVILAGWWLFNEWMLRDASGQDKRTWMTFLAVYAMAGTSYWLITMPSARSTTASLLLYCGCAAALVAVGCRAELRLCVRLLRERQAQGSLGTR